MVRRPAASILGILLSATLAASAVVFAMPVRTVSAAYAPPPLKVGVVKSAATKAWCMRHNGFSGYGIYEKQEAAYKYLANRGWDVSYLSDADLSSLTTLKKYDVVVLPWVFAMNLTPSKTVLRYIAEGGGVVSFWSPRVAPGLEPSSDPNESLPEKWVRHYQHEGWEWGPLSEAWQNVFIDDVGTVPFVAKAQKHSIVSGAKSILAARGYSNPNMTISRPEPYKHWIEIVRGIQGNKNSVPFLSWTFPSTFKNPANGIAYPGTYPAAVANEYGGGRAAVFFFPFTDWLQEYGGPLRNLAPYGTPLGEVVGAYYESAIDWVAATHTTTGKIVRGGLTWASVNVYQDGIYAYQYYTTAGNVVVGGTLKYRIYDPSGKLVYDSQLPRMGVEPGETRRYSHNYRTKRLADGYYTVVCEFEYSHTNGYAQKMKSRTWVRRGQGEGILTLPESTKPPTVYNTGPTVNPVSPNGDGVLDYTRFGFTLSRPSIASIDIIDSYGRVVARPRGASIWSGGPHSVRYDPRLPNGRYRWRITSRNTAGTRTRTGDLFISANILRKPYLGTSPTVSNCSPAPNPFTPNGDGIGDHTSIGFDLSAPAYVSVRVFDAAGEVSTLYDNVYIKAGRRTAKWNGANNAGRPTPAGTYSYYVFAQAGGNPPVNSLRSGLVTLKR